MMKKKVLLVEDEVTLASVIKRAFEKSGHQVTLASNGVEALSYLDNNIPDLILCDVTMPVMNGVELYNIICTTPHYARIPMVMMSGCDEPPFNGYNLKKFILKPFSIRDLQEVINWL